MLAKEYDSLQEDLAEICINLHREHSKKYGRVGDEEMCAGWRTFSTEFTIPSGRMFAKRDC